MNNNITESALIQEIEQLQEECRNLRDALEAQEIFSAMQKSPKLPAPDDPRYTKFIGVWNGYHAPEQRYEELAYHRREMRRAALKIDASKGDNQCTVS